MSTIASPKIYTSPIRKLARFFEKSRDQWKAKCRAAKQKLKRLTKRVRDLEVSRAHWKSRAQALQAELAAERRARHALEQVMRAQKQTEREAPLVAPAAQPPVPYRHRYSVEQVTFYVALVLDASVSLRGASRVIALQMEQEALTRACPDWTTGRLWLLRLGYYKLTRPKSPADDWAWIVDHTVQIGAEKCLLILGVRLSTLSTVGLCLTHVVVEPLALYPVQHSNGKVVYQQLEATVDKTGVPCAIVSDHGSDVKSGVERFGAAHPETRLVYDIKHKTAAILKRELEHDAQWLAFTALAAQTKSRLQQTDLAPCVPPNQRSKARYLNLEDLVDWGVHMLNWLDAPRSARNIERVQDSLGWVQDFRSALTEWKALWHVGAITESLIRQEGLYRGVQRKLKTQLAGVQTQRAKQVAAELVRFVAQQAAQARPKEHLLGSSEVIESVFGKFKYVERDQAHSGFTGLVLSLCALVGDTTQDVVQQALETVSTQEVLEWCKKNLGTSIQARRRELFAAPG